MLEYLASERELLNRAIATATEAHKSQVDLAGEPYIFHPLRVMDKVRANGYVYACVAVLHDVAEDCAGYNPHKLYTELGFPAEIVGPILAISHRPDEDYAVYISRCAASPVARKVKIADLMDHLSRMDGLPDATVRRLHERYRRALIVLNNAEVSSGKLTEAEVLAHEVEQLL